MFGRNTRKREKEMAVLQAEATASIEKLRIHFDTAAAKADPAERHMAYTILGENIDREQKNILQNLKKNNGDDTKENISAGSVATGMVGLLSGFVPLVLGYEVLGSIVFAASGGLAIGGAEVLSKIKNRNYKNNNDIAAIMAGHDALQQDIKHAKENILSTENDALMTSPHLEKMLEQEPGLITQLFKKAVDGAKDTQQANDQKPQQKPLTGFQL